MASTAGELNQGAHCGSSCPEPVSTLSPGRMRPALGLQGHSTQIQLCDLPTLCLSLLPCRMEIIIVPASQGEL